MYKKQKPVDRLKIARKVYHSPVEEVMASAGWLLFTMAAITVAAFFWPSALWIALPVMVFWVPMYLFEEFRMPLRMPMALDRLDPSTEMKIPSKMLGFLPVTVLRRTMGKAEGIFYTGYERAFDAGRELWLKTDDLTRHLILMATTGAGKTEMLLGYVLNALCWGRGLLFTDGKAQNDVWFAIASLARRFGREDDLRVINYITGGQSRSQRLLEENNTRSQSNTINPYALAQETYIIQLMDSMLPSAGNDGTWQDKAKSMNQTLTTALIYMCRREKKVMSQRLIQEYMPLVKFAELYQKAVSEDWHEEITSSLRNYLSSVPGFDMSLVGTPSEWSQEPKNQHGYLTSQYNRMLSMFSDTYGHVFSTGAGDIDLRDVVHNDRILVVLIPALELSSSEAATLGKLTSSQLAMILSQDLGERMEGTAKDTLVIRKYREKFPFLWLADEVGAYYSETIGALATQVRSLGYALVLAGQDLQRLKSAVGDKIWTLIGNMYIRIAGTLNDPKETLEMYQKAGGSEYEGVQDRMDRQPGILGTGGFTDAAHISLKESHRIRVEEVSSLKKGEQVTVFEGDVIRNSALYISDEDKITSQDIRINRFIEVPYPSVSDMLKLIPARQRRTRPRSEAVGNILAVLKGARKQRLRHDPANLIITDGALFAVAEEAAFCDEVEIIPPAPTDRAARLCSIAASMLRETKGQYDIEYPDPAPMTVKQDDLDRYLRFHQSAVIPAGADGFIH